MTKRRSAEDMSGSTFADLYDIQEELNRQQSKPLGRPKKKVKRNPTTIHLTKEEKLQLNRLHLILSEHLSLNKSEIVGIAIETLSEIISNNNDDGTPLNNARSIEDLKRRVRESLET